MKPETEIRNLKREAKDHREEAARERAGRIRAELAAKRAQIEADKWQGRFDALLSRVPVGFVRIAESAGDPMRTNRLEGVVRDVNVEDCYHALAECYSTDDPIRVRNGRSGPWCETTVSDLYMQCETTTPARSIQVSYWAGKGFGEIVEGNLYEMVIDRLAYYHEQRAEALRKRWGIMRKTRGRKRISNARRKK